MSHYQHSLVLEANPDTVYAALTAPEGLCSDGWRHFLGSLRQYAETGRGTPYELEAAAAAH